ncbi:Monocarboxylate transporter 9 [Armadillidium vulgare]|nr:Monocarboxylate transporter 9 [Armadillidium vulgare]
MNNLRSSSVTSDDSPPKLSDKEQISEDNKSLIVNNVKMVPPDGGWGWMVVGGSFLIMCLGTFPLMAFSILFSPILMSGGASSTKTAWIYNMYHLIWSCYTIFIGPLCEQFGTRKVAIFGGVASFLSLFLSAFVPTPDYLFFTFVLPGGISTSSVYALSFMVVSSYFEKHRGLAIGITSLGSSLSSFITPVMANYLLENYGYIGAAVISAALTLNQCVGASLFQPVKWHMKPAKTSSVDQNVSKDLEKSNKEAEETDLLENFQLKERKNTQISSTMDENKNDAYKIMLRNQKPKNKYMKVLSSTYNNLKSLKYTRVHIISWSYFSMSFGSSNFYMWIPFVITSRGYSLELAAWCTSISSLGNLTGRILMTLLSDRKFFNVIYGFMFGQFLMGCSIIAFSLVEDFKIFMIATCCFGFGVGCTLSSYVTVMIKVMGIEMLPAVLGVSSIYKGLAGIIFGPLIGAIRDATQSYTVALWLLGAAEFSGVFMLLLIPLGEKFDNWNMRRLERKKKHKMATSFL